MSDRGSDLMMAAAGREPHAVSVTREDALRVMTLSAAAGAVVLSGRVLGLDGRIVPFEQRCPLANDRSTPTAIVIPLSDGWLLSLSAVLEAGTVAWGQAFLRVDLTRGAGAIGTVLATLMQGAVTEHQRRAWPGSVLAGTGETPGTIRTFSGTNPAAGAEISETVPAGARWRLLAMRTTLTTDATVANRRPVIIVDDGTLIYYSAAGAADITASVGIPVSFVRGFGPPQSSGGQHLIPLPPDAFLLPGHRVRTLTTNLQAGDDYAVPVLTVEEWIEGI